MKKLSLISKDKHKKVPTPMTEESQTLAIVVLAVVVVVLVSIVAVLLAQGNEHRKAIDRLESAVLPASDQ